MTNPISRRSFAAAAAGIVAAARGYAAEPAKPAGTAPASPHGAVKLPPGHPPVDGKSPHGANPHGANPHGANPHGVNPHNPHGLPSNPGPIEAPFERDYPAPDFKPSWRRPQINRQLVQDFVIYAHSDLPMTRKLLTKEPGLIAATMNWGADDWESGFNGAVHMGRRDIVGYLLENGARIDIFCAAMLGELEVVRTFLKLQPKLIDAKGPHGFTLHFHAQVGGKEAEPVLDYLQSVKKLELRPVPFLSKPQEPAKT